MGPRLLLPLLAAAVSACSDPPGVEGCLGDVDISVVRFDPPEFSWTPGCAVVSVQVDDAADRSMWIIRAHVNENELTPPITYGVVPRNAVEEFSPQPFLHGNFYIVRVFRLHRVGEEVQYLFAGQQNFPW